MNLFPVKMQGGGKFEHFLFLELSQICVIMIIHTNDDQIPTVCIPGALYSLLLPSLYP